MTQQSITDQVFEFLESNKDQGFSGNEVFHHLAFADHRLSPTIAVIDIRASLSYLLDQKKIQFNDQRKYQSLGK